MDARGDRPQRFELAPRESLAGDFHSATGAAIHPPDAHDLASVVSQLRQRLHDRLGQALNALLDAGSRAGVLRHDIDARDVILLSWFLAHVNAEEWADRVPRLLDVLIKGLSADGGRLPPGDA